MATKKDYNREATGAAITGAGGVTATAGYAAGGIPGARANPDKIKAWGSAGSGKGGRARQAASKARARAGVVRATPAGIGGYRTKAHEQWTKGHAAEQAHHAKGTPLSGLNRQQAFQRGQAMGKIPAEKQIIRHMKGLHRGGNAALIGGAGVAAYGLKHAKGEKLKKRDDRRRQFESNSGALLGGGATMAGLGAGGSKVLRGQQRKWKARGAAARSEAAKLIPRTAGRAGETIATDKKILAGQTKNVAHQAGALRGEAGQHLYFARQYGTNAKMVGRATKPGLALAGVGAAGLAGSRGKDAWDKKRVSKRMSAFGVEH